MCKTIWILLATLAFLLTPITPSWAQDQLPPGPSCAKLATDQQDYQPGELVTILFLNNCSDRIGVGYLPWRVKDSNGQEISIGCEPPHSVCGIPGILLLVHPGEKHAWTWNQKNSLGQQVRDGTYAIEMKAILHAGMTAAHEVAYSASFSVGMGELASLEQFDINGNNKIDDSEFFSAIDLWVTSTIRDDLLFAVLDAWVSQAPIKATASSSSEIGALSIYASKTSLAFIATGSDVTRLTVAVFDLDGRLVFSQRASGTRLIWNLKTQSGKPLAHGIYLAAVIVHGPDGRITRELRKLAVLR